MSQNTNGLSLYKPVSRSPSLRSQSGVTFNFLLESDAISSLTPLGEPDPRGINRVRAK